MKDLFAKCGVNCGHCPSYKENLKTDLDRQRCSDGWHKYHGFRLAPDKIRPCDGCQIYPEKLTYRVCPVSHIRNCAIKTGVETCANCSVYPCEALKVHKDINREEVASRLGAPIPEEDYLTFIEPYEGLNHLKAIRASLKPVQIVEAVKVPHLKSGIIDFPEDLPLTEDETAAFKALHQLLSTISTITADSYATQEMLSRRRQYFLKLLWMFGLYGEFKEDHKFSLVSDGETYLDQNLEGKQSRVVQYFELLKEYGVHCDLVPLGDGWLLPSGWLRRKTKKWNKGWFITMALDDTSGGSPALKALKSYATNLDEKYGKKAFRYFLKADMQILKEKIRGDLSDKR